MIGSGVGWKEVGRAVELERFEGRGLMTERRTSKSSENRSRILEAVRNVLPRKLGRMTAVLWVGGERNSVQIQTGSAKMRPCSSHVMQVQWPSNSRAIAIQ